MALGVIRAASDLGVRIPEDLAVVGFDDIEIADHPRVQLTTMAQQKADMGRLAALGILEVIHGRAGHADAPVQQILAPTLGHPPDVRCFVAGARLGPSGKRTRTF